MLPVCPFLLSLTTLCVAAAELLEQQAADYLEFERAQVEASVSMLDDDHAMECS
eukprot:NODE_4912_length_304_cov_57.345098_g4467_i0.p1 GENE.NODE_4912_length_304_cov_57.345098_g4467_i0~~NODE_4912_length_304_cov_57.345098_g4467_i0.p1  ORF type:complete len:54 (-),score=1.77 NODE_4912_length_304_cov_57.345098_g4467_i0:75-236(-)